MVKYKHYRLKPRTSSSSTKRKTTTISRSNLKKAIKKYGLSKVRSYLKKKISQGYRYTVTPKKSTPVRRTYTPVRRTSTTTHNSGGSSIVPSWIKNRTIKKNPITTKTSSRTKYIKHSGGSKTTSNFVKSEKTKNAITNARKQYDDETILNKISSKYGKTSTQYKRVAKALNYYKNTPTNTKEYKNPVDTETGAPIGFKPMPKQVKKTPQKQKHTLDVFKKKWNSPERQAAAKAAGIENYTGTTKQNILLRSKLRPFSDLTKTENKTLNNKTENKTLNNNPVKDNKKDKSIVPDWIKNNQVKKNPNPMGFNKTITERTVNELRKELGDDKNVLDATANKYGTDSEQYKKLEKALKAYKQKDGTENLDKLNNLNKEELKNKQIETLKIVTDKKISETANNFINSAKVENANNKQLQNFYKNLEKEMDDFVIDVKKTKKDALERTKTTELNRVAGQVRAMLASRGISMKNISPEQLISMSGELGVKALEEINKATNKMEEEINDITSKSMDKINTYKEKGLISQAQHDKEIERLREMKVKLTSDLKDNYITSAFKMAFNNKKEDKVNNGAVINTVNALAVQLGLQPTQMGVINKYTNYADSQSATKAMLEDLADKNSALYKAVKSNKDAANKIANFKNYVRNSSSTTKKERVIPGSLAAKITTFVTRNNPNINFNIDDYSINTLPKMYKDLEKEGVDIKTLKDIVNPGIPGTSN